MDYAKKCIKVPVVIGVGSTQHLICTEIPLSPPALEIKDIQKRVVIDSCVVGGPDKVIINARLLKNINFKTSGEETQPNGITIICGDLRHCFIQIPFCTFVEVKGALPGDLCQVEEAVVEAQVEEEIRCPDTGLVERIIDKDVVRIVLKAERIEQIFVPAEKCPPPPEC